MFYFPGNEVINFQTNSKIGKQLTNIFQEIIDYRDSLTSEQFANEAQRHQTVITKTTDYFIKKGIPQITAALREMNINLTDFYVYSGDSGFSCNAAIIVHNKDIEAVIELERRSVGLNPLINTNPTKKDLVELAKVTEITDLKTGTFSKSTFANGKKVNITLFFDVNTFLLAQEFYPGHEDKLYTAPEIAAVLLHEIGHVHSISEHLSNLYYYRERQQNIEVTLRNADFKTLKEAAPEMLSEIKKKLKSLNTDDPSVDRAMKVCDTLAKFLNDKKIDSDSDTVEGEALVLGNLATNPFLNFLGILISFTLSMLFSFMAIVVFVSRIMIRGGILSPIRLAQEFLIFTSHLRPDQDIRKSTDTKFSDNTSTMMNYTYIERWADEYVSRMGYGAELASALNKLDYWMTVASGAGPIRSAAVRNSNFAITMTYISGWMARHFGLGIWFMDDYTYENQYNRVARLRQNLFAVFKNEDLPGEIVDNYIGSLRKLEEELKQAKSIFDNDLFIAVRHFVYTITTVSGIKDLITDANLERDYYKLQNRLDDLSNNPLFYQAARLSRK